MTTQEGLPALATDEREVEDLMRMILRAWKPCSSPQGHPHMEWAEIAARAVHKERTARAEAAEARLASTETDLHRARVMWDETAARQVKLEISLAEVTAERDFERGERRRISDLCDETEHERAVDAASAATMREALIDCQRVLALLADRHAAVSAPNVVSIWAQTVAAEAKARAALGGQHG